MTKLTGIITSESKLEGNLGVRNEINVDIIGTGKLTGKIMSENKLTGNLGVRNEINVGIIGTGARGKEGKSAYEIWLDLGNEGTEQEYLASLKGQDGYTPAKDVDYFDGEKGDKGESGVYVGSGDMPDGYNVQIDPDGEGSTLEALIAEAMQDAITTEEWTFTLDDETEVTKMVMVG